VIEAVNLTKRYGDKTAVDDVTCDRSPDGPRRRTPWTECSAGSMWPSSSSTAWFISWDAPTAQGIGTGRL